MNRRSDPGFEPRVADWLEEDPTRAPHAVLDTVLAAFPSIPQRRRPLRFVGGRAISMSSFLKVGLAAAAVVAVVAAGSLVLNRANGPSVGATPEPSATPVSSAATGTYTSARYGFSMVHPPGWQVVPARADWQNEVHVIGSQWLDHLDDPNSEVQMFGARQELPAGTTADAWIDQYIRRKAADAGGVCGDMSPGAYQPVDIQGEAGRQITTTCGGADDMNYYAAALVVHDGSAYLISYARGGGEEPGDEEAFARLVESFSFPAE